MYNGIRKLVAEAEAMPLALNYDHILQKQYITPVYSLHGYVSKASSTLIICCFMHFVASPACGIMNRSTILTD